MIWCPGYDIVDFMRAISGHERFRERCRICYEIRLARTALLADEHGFDLFCTTLLISPYQDQTAIREIGERLAVERNAGFYFENLRRGFAEHHAMARAHGLYQQRYCGCVYSEWEALDRSAPGREGRAADSIPRAQ